MWCVRSAMDWLYYNTRTINVFVRDLNCILISIRRQSDHNKASHPYTSHNECLARKYNGSSMATATEPKPHRRCILFLFFSPILSQWQHFSLCISPKKLKCCNLQFALQHKTIYQTIGQKKKKTNDEKKY